ncbi:MAG: hypothetical protein JOZ19_14660 [Rubrobacter sp.]|nr:hypothetical protein [Rubrobacter sp.]
MEIIVLVLVVVGAVLVLVRFADVLPVLIFNAGLGLVLLVLSHLFLSPPVPANLVTILVCIIGGVAGWLMVMVLYTLGIAFYVPF